MAHSPALSSFFVAFLLCASIAHSARAQDPLEQAEEEPEPEPEEVAEPEAPDEALRVDLVVGARPVAMSRLAAGVTSVAVSSRPRSTTGDTIVAQAGTLELGGRLDALTSDRDFGGETLGITDAVLLTSPPVTPSDLSRSESMRALRSSNRISSTKAFCKTQPSAFGCPSPIGLYHLPRVRWAHCLATTVWPMAARPG